MASPKILIIVGSLRKESINLKLAKALQKLGDGKMTTSFASIGDLPLFSQDLEPQPPASVTKLKNDIEGADGILVVTPEYNRSMPGPLKNAIDWASRPYGKNSFAKKPLALFGASSSHAGTACSQQHLKPIFNYLDTLLMGQPEMYIQFKEDMLGADGSITNEKTREFFVTFLDKFVAFIGKHK